MLENTLILLLFFQFYQLLFCYRTLAKLNSFWNYQLKHLHGRVAFFMKSNGLSNSLAATSMARLRHHHVLFLLNALFPFLVINIEIIPTVMLFYSCPFSVSLWVRVLPLPPEYIVEILSAFSCLYRFFWILWRWVGVILSSCATYFICNWS